MTEEINQPIHGALNISAEHDSVLQNAPTESLKHEDQPDDLVAAILNAFHDFNEFGKACDPFTFPSAEAQRNYGSSALADYSYSTSSSYSFNGPSDCYGSSSSFNPANDNFVRPTSTYSPISPSYNAYDNPIGGAAPNYNFDPIQSGVALPYNNYDYPTQSSITPLYNDPNLMNSNQFSTSLSQPSTLYSTLDNTLSTTAIRNQNSLSYDSRSDTSLLSYDSHKDPQSSSYDFRRDTTLISYNSNRDPTSYFYDGSKDPNSLTYSPYTLTTTPPMAPVNIDPFKPIEIIKFPSMIDDQNKFGHNNPIKFATGNVDLSKSNIIAAGVGGGGGDDGDGGDGELHKLLEMLLKDHEGGIHDGHAYKDHVDQKLEDFTERFEKEPHKGELSSFKDATTAERVYRELLNQKGQEIRNWIRSGEDRGGFNIFFNEEIGYGIKKGESSISPRSGARFVLTKTPEGPRILSAYPIKDEKSGT